MDDTPTKLFLETSLPTSASPYPSPSSAFYPPPIPASHEFANKLGGNKRYRGSGGSHYSSAGALASPIATNGLGPSSADSSRRGSASGPSPLAMHPAHLAQLDGVVGLPLEDQKVEAAAVAIEDMGTGSTPSHDRIIPGSGLVDTNRTMEPRTPPTADSSTQNAAPPTNSSNSANPSTTSTNPSTPSASTPTSTYPTSTTTTTTTTTQNSAQITPATSKRTSQILESLTPIRAAPPSPAPSRRGSLIRRGSSRRWSRGSRGSGALGTPSASGGDPIGLTTSGIGGIGGMAGIGSAWLGESTGTTSSTVSEDGSLSGEPGPNSPEGNAAASRRASRRLSAFSALASTMEGEVVSFNDLVAKEDVYLSPSALSPEVVESETEPVTPATPALVEIQSAPNAEATIVASTTPEQETTSPEHGFTALKPILVVDFAFPPSDARHTQRPLELLSRVEREALTLEERGAYARAGRKGEEEWEEAAEEEEEGQWGWIGVRGLGARLREGFEEDDDGGEEMTPRFGYGDDSTPTGETPNSYANAGGYSGAGGGDEGGELNPDSPLPPGIYRALYAFEAEGTAEMSLFEGQLVRVVGRGGGVGWAVAERSWRPENSGSAVPGGGGGGEGDSTLGGSRVEDAALDAGMASEESSGALGLAGQALVPEGYLEIWMLDGEEWGVGDVDDF